MIVIECGTIHRKGARDRFQVELARSSIRRHGRIVKADLRGRSPPRMTGSTAMQIKIKTQEHVDDSLVLLHHAGRGAAVPVSR